MRAKASVEELWSWAFPSCIDKALDSAESREGASPELGQLFSAQGYT